MLDPLAGEAPHHPAMNFVHDYGAEVVEVAE